MRIANKEYIDLEIERNLNYYILQDIVNLKHLTDDNHKEQVEIDIYEAFIKHLEQKYSCEITDIERFKEDIIYFEIQNENILFNLIEQELY